MKNEALTKALASLDAENDEHWTADGLPRVDVVEGLLGGKADRQAITEAAPHFTRDAWRAQKAAQPPTDEKPTIAEIETAMDEGKNPEIKADGTVTFDELTEQEQLVATLDEQAHEKLEEIREAEAEVAAAQKRVVALNAEHDQLRFKRESAMPSPTHQESIRAYIDSQNKIRAERVARRNKALEGLKPSDLRKGSPLDEAHQRRNQRGTKRPGRLPLQTTG